MSVLVIMALILEVVVLSWLENRVTGTRITPFGLLGFPYAAVVLAAFLLGPLLDFVPLDIGSLTIWMCGLFLLWVTGHLFVRILLGGQAFHCIAQRLKSQFAGEASSEKMSTLLATLMIPMLVLGVLLSVRAAGGWSNLASPEFKAAHAYGLPAHALIASEPLFILLVGTAKKTSKLQIALCGILTVFFLLGQVKGRVLQTLIGGFLYRAMRGRASVSARNIGIVLFCGLFVFVSIYLFAFSITDLNMVLDSGTYILLSRHFCFYLMSGVLGFSEVSRTATADVGGGSAAEIFRPFVNVYRILFDPGKLVGMGSTHEKGMQIDLTDESVDANTNVYTLFGTLYLYLGILGSLAYVIVMAALCYALFFAAGRTRNEWLLVLYCFVGAQLLFGFFEFYFWHSDTYEIAIYTAMFAGFSSLVRRPFSLAPA